MFVRAKKVGRYTYLQLVENKRVEGKTRQRVVATLGRLDQLEKKGGVEALVLSLARFSHKVKVQGVCEQGDLEVLGEHKEGIEEALFARTRDLFTDLRLVFFDTTSLYLVGEGGKLGERGDLLRDLVGVRHEGKRYILRTPLKGVAGKVFEAVGVAVPPPVQEVRVVPRQLSRWHSALQKLTFNFQL